MHYINNGIHGIFCHRINIQLSKILEGVDLDFLNTISTWNAITF